MKSLFGASLLALAVAGTQAAAVEIKWVDWLSSTTDAATGFTAYGTITSGSETIDVTYNNPRGVGFFQDGVGDTDWWLSGGVRDPATSPYTSVGANGVDNIPSGSDMIGLRYAGTQSLTFSQAIGNVVFAYISLNGNGYGFDQDFELLSSGGQNLDGNGVDTCGWWGCGTSTKVLDNGRYLLTGTGEPHGALRFTGIFDSVTWDSLNNEYWNGFTVGVQGTADQVFPEAIPLPATGWLLIAGLGGLAAVRRKG